MSNHCEGVVTSSGGGYSIAPESSSVISHCESGTSSQAIFAKAGRAVRGERGEGKERRGERGGEGKERSGGAGSQE